MFKEGSRAKIILVKILNFFFLIFFHIIPETYSCKILFLNQVNFKYSKLNTKIAYKIKILLIIVKLIFACECACVCMYFVCLVFFQ